jgi:glutathione synthase/RimK-type ligase-like ATP-grasp enzyme
VTVYVLTHSGDYDVPDRVLAAAAALGRAAVRIDTDLFPRSATGALSFGGAALDAFLPGAKAVWCRRVWTAQKPPAVEGAHQQACQRQARAFFAGALATLALRGVRVLNDPSAELRAEHKPLQLQAARELGFLVPPTWIGNDPESATTFLKDARAAGVPVVIKLLSPLSVSMDGSGAFLHTTTLPKDAIEHVCELVHAPVILQHRLPKTHDLRVIVVGDTVLCGALFDKSDDWRLHGRGRWLQAELAPLTARRCVGLCRVLGLDVAAIDLVRTDDGGEHFLEVNPAGEWGFLARDCGLPIAEALAARLVHG